MYTVLHHGLKNALSVGVEDDFGEHLRMVAIPASTGIGSGKNLVVQTINSDVDESGKMVFGDI